MLWSILQITVPSGNTLTDLSASPSVADMRIGLCHLLTFVELVLCHLEFTRTFDTNDFTNPIRRFI